MPLDHIVPNWPVPASVRALSTLRTGGVSVGCWGSLNLADHVGDDPAAVSANRRLLRGAAGLPEEPHWLEQIHGCDVAEDPWATQTAADAVTTSSVARVCAVLTADCLPVLLCNFRGNRVAAVHAGWRGLAAGVLEAALRCFSDGPKDIFAWLGPAIGPRHFEVGEEVLQAFLRQDDGATGCFRTHRPGHWLADLYALARRRLHRYGVTRVYGGGWCTYADPQRFFSYRRDGTTGRMATLIWIDPEDAR